ncbi:protein pangolin, isoforms A/H/I/S isoform X2 [Drosophila serrata]|uniref:protein pangolin, isoforms A/H/I/S isoform X2 n=1 Tax=Drosophila serrata TaxID=7274 RepID=UPI000A1D3773|nr:protein pangolin, isoforms A/H/I/S isoform X2 [Drosophila serrata]
MPHTHTRHGSSGDDLCSTDEVKIFKDEGDREDDKISSENLLVEEKSSLIDLTESEEKSQKVVRADHSPVFNKLDTHTPSFNMGYLVSPYSYANGAANGLPVTMANKIGLPPFFCHNADPLATPPPAHCGIPPYQLDPKAIGLTRPALYPFATGQYPYPMLGSDMSQVASWHTPSVYSASSFRTPYPSSLPINTTLPSDFPFRFSPSLLPSVHATSHHVLNSHSAIVGSSSKQDCGSHQDSTTNNRYPRNLDTKNTSSNQSNDSSKDISNDKKKPHIKKPLNAFMLYMKEMRAKVVAECTLKESAAINQILGRRWHALGREEQAKYYELARRERQLHMQMYPDWSSRTNASRGKKRKRKQDTNEGGNNMKKCRARFGLDQQNQWCKPCRRKKKCIRYMEAMNGNSGILEDGSGMDDHGSDDDDDDDDDDDVKLNGSCGSVDADDSANKIDDDSESLDHGSMSSFAQSPSTTTTSLASPLNMINFINPTTPNPGALLINVNATEQQQQRSASVSASSTSASASSGSGGTTPSTSSTVSPVTTGIPGVNSSIPGANSIPGGGGTSSTLAERAMMLGNRFSHLGMGLSPVFATTTAVGPGTGTGTGTGTNKLEPFLGNNNSLNNLSNSPIPIPVMPNIIRNPIGANPRDINNPLSINQLTNHHQPSSLLKSSFSQHFQQQQQLINAAHMSNMTAVNNRSKVTAACSNINNATTTAMLSINSHHAGKPRAAECDSSHEKSADHHQQSNTSSTTSSGAGATETGAISVS